MADLTSANDQIDTAELIAVLTALRDGDLSMRMASGRGGRAGDVARILNSTLDMLCAYAAEQCRITEEIGVYGTLGGQAEVDLPLRGSWLDIIESLNRMSGRLAGVVRDTYMSAEAGLADAATTRRVSDRCIPGEFEHLIDNVNGLLDRLQPEPAAATSS